LDYKEDEVVGKSTALMFPPKTREKDTEAGPKKAISGEFVVNAELNLISKNGKRFPFSFNGTPLKDAEGKIIGAIGVGRDLREIRKLINELREAKTGLEEKVKERTKELEEAKTILEIKIGARTRELQKLNKSLERQVQEKTRELQERINELERFHRLAVGRELKMVELKKEIERLKKELEQRKK